MGSDPNSTFNQRPNLTKRLNAARRPLGLRLRRRKFTTLAFQADLKPLICSFLPELQTKVDGCWVLGCGVGGGFCRKPSFKTRAVSCNHLRVLPSLRGHGVGRWQMLLVHRRHSHQLATLLTTLLSSCFLFRPHSNHHSVCKL